MKIKTLLFDQLADAEILSATDAGYEISIDKKKVSIQISALTESRLNLMINGSPHHFYYTLENNQVHIHLNNRTFPITIGDQQAINRQRGKSIVDPDADEVIQTSMPGKVIDILVKVGDEVNHGDGIIIIEAMKMENEISCRRDGVVSKINVKPGDTIEAHSPLVEISPIKK